jgi:hypothetical protein
MDIVGISTFYEHSAAFAGGSQTRRFGRLWAATASTV